MKFDCVVGNPPWNKGICKDFGLLTLSILQPEGWYALITSTSWMSGTMSTAFRKSLFKFPVYELNILPTDTFDVDKDSGNQVILAAVYFIGQVTNHPTDISTVINYRFANKTFSWTDVVYNTDKDIRFLYDNIGKQIWNKCQSFPTKFDTSTRSSNRNNTLKRGPNVNVGEKTELQYFSRRPNALSTISGKKLWTGAICDDAGDWVEIENKTSSGNKRLIYRTDTPVQCKNLYRWMSSKLFGILLSMTSTQSSVSGTTVGQIPYIILNGIFNSDEEFNTAIYDELQLSSEERSWIASFGENV